MKEKLTQLLQEGQEKIRAARSEGELQEVKGLLLGKQGALTGLLKELPRLEKLHQSIPLRMLAISREEPDSSIRHFWQANNLSIPYAPQAGRQIYRQFAIRYIPRLYLTDSTGCIRHVFRSVTPNRKIRKAWKKLSSSTHKKAPTFQNRIKDSMKPCFNKIQ